MKPFINQSALQCLSCSNTRTLIHKTLPHRTLQYVTPDARMFWTKKKKEVYIRFPCRCNHTIRNNDILIKFRQERVDIILAILFILFYLYPFYKFYILLTLYMRDLCMNIFHCTNVSLKNATCRRNMQEG